VPRPPGAIEAGEKAVIEQGPTDAGVVRMAAVHPRPLPRAPLQLTLEMPPDNERHSKKTEREALEGSFERALP
jgi:hypothetical protein